IVDCGICAKGLRTAERGSVGDPLDRPRRRTCIENDFKAVYAGHIGIQIVRTSASSYRTQEGLNRARRGIIFAIEHPRRGVISSVVPVAHIVRLGESQREPIGAGADVGIYIEREAIDSSGGRPE